MLEIYKKSLHKVPVGLLSSEMGVWGLRHFLGSMV